MIASSSDGNLIAIFVLCVASATVALLLIGWGVALAIATTRRLRERRLTPS